MSTHNSYLIWGRQKSCIEISRSYKSVPHTQIGVVCVGMSLWPKVPRLGYPEFLSTLKNYNILWFLCQKTCNLLQNRRYSSSCFDFQAMLTPFHFWLFLQKTIGEILASMEIFSRFETILEVIMCLSLLGWFSIDYTEWLLHYSYHNQNSVSHLKKTIKNSISNLIFFNWHIFTMILLLLYLFIRKCSASKRC